MSQVDRKDRIPSPSEGSGSGNVVDHYAPPGSLFVSLLGLPANLHFLAFPRHHLDLTRSFDAPPAFSSTFLATNNGLCSDRQPHEHTLQAPSDGQDHNRPTAEAV